MKILVCGGRGFGVAQDDSPSATRRANAEIAGFQRAMDALHARYKFTQVLNGGAKGADTLAKLWANRRDIASQTWKDDWDANERSAGPIRNQQMLDEGHTDMVVAFPGGRGTADMVARARRSGVRVVEVADGLLQP